MKFTIENFERLTLAKMQEVTEGDRDVEFTLEGGFAARDGLSGGPGVGDRGVGRDADLVAVGPGLNRR